MILAVVEPVVDPVVNTADQTWVVLIVAVIGAVGAVASAVIGKKNRRENKLDHGQVIEAIEKLGRSISRVHRRMDDHLEWHAGHPAEVEHVWDGDERRDHDRDDDD